MKDVHEMNEYNQKKTCCIWKFFHPWILRRARSAGGALVGFIFILRQQRKAARAPHHHTELQKYTVWRCCWCGATLIIDDKKLTKCSLNKSLTFSNELFLVQFLQNICRSISALSQISLRRIFDLILWPPCTLVSKLLYLSGLEYNYIGSVHILRRRKNWQI